MKNPKEIYWRWLAELSTYNYSLLWKPGKSIGCSIALSRSPHMDKPTREEHKESGEFIAKLEDEIRKEVCAMRNENMSIGEIREAQGQDEVLAEVSSWVSRKTIDKEDLRGLSEEH